MKLRIKGSSVRLRLDQRDLHQLLTTGRVEDGMSLSPRPQEAFSYAVEIDDTLQTELALTYESGHFLLRIAQKSAEDWNRSAQVGFDVTQTSGDAFVRIVLEKDFACLDRPRGEEEDDAFAFPHPGAGCSPNPPERP